MMGTPTALGQAPAVKGGLEVAAKGGLLIGKPWHHGAVIGLALGAVIAGILYWQFVTPKQKQITAQDAKLAKLQQDIQQGRAAKRNLPQFREEVRVLELELDKLLRILPARRNTPELIRRVRLLVEQGDFDLKRFRPSAPQDRDFFSEWPITINLDGSYHNLALFFDRISRFSRIINIDNLKVSALKRTSGAKSINATFTAKTFIYKEPALDDEPLGAGGGR